MAESTYFFKGEYAKSGRARCKYKACGRTIEKGELRLAREYQSDRFTEGGIITEWYHPGCLFERFKGQRKTTERVVALEEIEGVEDWTAEEKESVIEMIADVKDHFGSEEVAPKKRKRPDPVEPERKKVKVVEYPPYDIRLNGKCLAKPVYLDGTGKLVAEVGRLHLQVREGEEEKVGRMSRKVMKCLVSPMFNSVIVGCCGEHDIHIKKLNGMEIECSPGSAVICHNLDQIMMFENEFVVQLEDKDYILQKSTKEEEEVKEEEVIESEESVESEDSDEEDDGYDSIEDSSFNSDKIESDEAEESSSILEEELSHHSEAVEEEEEAITDILRENGWLQAERVGGLPLCWFGDLCPRRDARHLSQYNHSRKHISSH